MKSNNPMILKKHCLATAVACAYMTLAIAPAYASDTEIYVDNIQSSAIAPNLMMVFDTSGSMAECVDSADGSSCADVNKKRINVLKTAMRQLLRGDPAAGITPAPGYVKMGVTRYHADSNRGGYVLYPTRPLDAFVEINPNGIVSNIVATADGDAIQGFTQTTSGTSTSAAVKIGVEGSNDYIAGFQFANVRIPRGATVTNAYIEVTPNANTSGLTIWEVSAEASGNANTYASTQINTRSYGNTTNYSPPTWTNGVVTQIPVTLAINEVVKRSDWCGGNALSVRIRDIGGVKSLRTAHSFNTAGSDAAKPRLVVNYLVNPDATDSCIKNISKNTVLTVANSNDDAYWAANGSSTTNTTASSLTINSVGSGSVKRENGIRFSKVQIPKNATINSAVLRVTSNNDYSPVANTRIMGFSSPNVDFCPSGTCSTPTVLKDLPVTSNSQVWNPGSVAKNVAYDIDVKNIVQEIVNNSAWDVDKNIGFKLFNDTTTSRNTAIYSFNGSSTRQPRLIIDWTVNELNNLTVLETVRDQLEAEVNALTIPSSTPLAGAMAAATRYMYGLQPYFKEATDYDPRVVVNPGNTATVRYVSPIPEDDQCSANYIFLLTDGEPNYEADIKNDAKAIMESSTAVCSGSSGAANWDCMKKLATYNNGISKLNGQPKKRIYTSTMILGPLSSAEANMQQVASLGGGKTYKATDTGALVAGLLDVVEESMKKSGTISAAGVAVNQLNRLNHLDQLYYAVFDPRPNSLRWEGNLKRYRLGNDGAIYDDTSPPLGPQNAVDSTTGFFKKEAKSFWSTEVDGDIASMGGAASKLPIPNDRKMYTYTGALTTQTAPVNLTPIDLTNNAFNSYAQGKTGTTGDEYLNLMKWYQGYDVSSLVDDPANATTFRYRMGGALHSRPLLINYGFNGSLSTAANATNQKNYVFFSTMEGTLHAIDANTGIEKFSFIPGEKLSVLKELYTNPSSALPAFGMDLTWTSYRKDNDGSGQIGTGDKVWLYGGMRMGGDDYYALDVTDLNSPKLMFAIDGGKAGTKYARMGQTWSEPVITNIYLQGKPKRVMIFGGGYDEKHENHNLALPFADIDKGNQVYIVDAEKGDLLWMASGNSTDSPDKLVDDMKFSIPSSPKALDLDSDGIADVIYIGDLGGQLFRIDLDRKASSNANIAKRVKLIAQIGQTEPSVTINLAAQRRFYEPPAVATFTDSSGQRFATVAIGSGYRSRPLNTITDERFYTFFDYDVTKSNLLSLADTALQPVIKHADLALLDLQSSAIKQDGIDQTKKGWYVDFSTSGEKSLASPLIYSGQLLFTSYTPSQSMSSNCSPVTGNTSLYVMCMPYGKLCAAGEGAQSPASSPNANKYKQDNIMLGLGGEPTIMRGPDEDGNDSDRIIIGTTVKEFNKDVPAPTLQPTKKWREKNPK